MVISGFGGATNLTIFSLGKILTQKKTEFQKLMENSKPAIEGSSQKFDVFMLCEVSNKAEVRKGEMPSVNCHGNARGMAELAAIMANKGKRLTMGSGDESKESDLLSEETWNKFHDAEKVAVDALFPGGMLLL